MAGAFEIQRTTYHKDITRIVPTEQKEPRAEIMMLLNIFIAVLTSPALHHLPATTSSARPKLSVMPAPPRPLTMVTPSAGLNIKSVLPSSRFG